MRHRTPATQSARSRLDRGFTLIEILIVITVITVLLTLTAVVLSNSINQARIAATKATLTKLDGLLQQRLDAYRVMLDSPQWKATLGSKVAAKQQALASGNNYTGQQITGLQGRMLELLVYKDAFRSAFPQSQIDNPSLYATGQPFAGNAQNAAESAELLYWILTKSDSFGVPPVDDSEFSASEVGDTDGDGRKEFVDSWGQPMRFYRWPTRLVRPGGPGTAVARPLASVLISGLPSAAAQTGDVDPLEQDPDDRLGVYESTVAAKVMTQQQYEVLVHTPDTYTVPLVVSSGPDRDLGLGEPFDNTPATLGRLAMPTAATLADPLNSALTDNLTNRQKQK